MSASNITDLWSLSNGATRVSAAGAGVTEIVRRRAATGVETCLLRADGSAFDAVPRFAYGSTVRVLRGGVTWFVGRVIGNPGTGEAGSESVVYRLDGPWWYLEQLVYQQEWALRGGEETGWMGRVILGQRMDGDRIHSGQIIKDVLQYAIDAGAPFQIGTVEPNAILPLDELRDMTCAEIIRRTLRWHPDCVSFFDHGTLPTPTFHCRKRASLPAVTFTVGRAPLAAVRGIAARADLLVPAVVLRYETTTVDGEIDVLSDVAPEGATDREFGALVATIPVRAAVTEESEAVAFSSAAELPPRGEAAGISLAQAMHEARNALQYSGSVLLVEREAGGTAAGVGRVLNLAGAARGEWATMRATVTEEETRVGDGVTTLRFGPSEGEGSLRAEMAITRSGQEGREPGSPAAVETRNSGGRTTGRRGG